MNPDQYPEYSTDIDIRFDDEIKPIICVPMLDKDES